MPTRCWTPSMPSQSKSMTPTSKLTTQPAQQGEATQRTARQSSVQAEQKQGIKETKQFLAYSIDCGPKQDRMQQTQSLQGWMFTSEPAGRPAMQPALHANEGPAHRVIDLVVAGVSGLCVTPEQWYAGLVYTCRYVSVASHGKPNLGNGEASDIHQAIQCNRANGKEQGHDDPVYRLRLDALLVPSGVLCVHSRKK
jgi:hypothetical protein